MTGSPSADPCDRIVSYLRRSKVFSGLPGANPDAPPSVSFLAQGEYNANYLVEAGDIRYVFRVNHGSQLGLADQISYEFEALSAVTPSGVTPEPFFADPAPEGFPGGVLLMRFIPGRALDYASDLEKAGRTFARIHALAPSDRLIVQADPVADIARESLALLRRFPDHPRRDVLDDLLAYHGRIERLGRENREFFAADPPCMVNTEVNSGNFIVDGEAARLVDWEKAVVSSRYQDLGHFVCPTTTLWKTDVTLGGPAVARFLRAYARELERLGRRPPSQADLERGTSLLSKVIILRGLSWCFMAWHEYAGSGRTLKNPAAFAVIERYLDNRRCFLAAAT